MQKRRARGSAAARRRAASRGHPAARRHRRRRGSTAGKTRRDVLGAKPKDWLAADASRARRHRAVLHQVSSAVEIRTAGVRGSSPLDSFIDRHESLRRRYQVPGPKGSSLSRRRRGRRIRRRCTNVGEKTDATFVGAEQPRVAAAAVAPFEADRRARSRARWLPAARGAATRRRARGDGQGADATAHVKPTPAPPQAATTHAAARPHPKSPKDAGGRQKTFVGVGSKAGRRTTPPPPSYERLRTPRATRRRAAGVGTTPPPRLPRRRRRRCVRHLQLREAPRVFQVQSPKPGRR